MHHNAAPNKLSKRAFVAHQKLPARNLASSVNFVASKTSPDKPPRNVPAVLVGDAAEDDVAAEKRVLRRVDGVQPPEASSRAG